MATKIGSKTGETQNKNRVKLIVKIVYQTCSQDSGVRTESDVYRDKILSVYKQFFKYNN